RFRSKSFLSRRTPAYLTEAARAGGKTSLLGHRFAEEKIRRHSWLSDPTSRYLPSGSSASAPPRSHSCREDCRWRCRVERCRTVPTARGGWGTPVAQTHGEQG